MIMLFTKKNEIKTLYLMRHAKSSWEDFNLSDHDRPILPIGEKRTKKMADYMLKNKIQPEKFISSTANRAMQTAGIIADTLGYEKSKIEQLKKLYHAYPSDIYDEIFAVDNKINSLIVFGHNPGFTDFVNQFLKPEIDNLPTSGLVSIVFKTKRWEEIINSKFKVGFCIFPSTIRK